MRRALSLAAQRARDGRLFSTTPIPVTAPSSFYRRPLPTRQIAFSSPEGKQLFREALEQGGLDGYFNLAEVFHTQSEPAFCGLSTLAMVLNALSVDPNRQWKGPWRWYSEEMLECCRDLPHVKEHGIQFDEFACLARCNGVVVDAFRTDLTTEEHFRSAVVAATTQRELHCVVSFSRQMLGQTGQGHFSPIGAYHKEKDLALVLDTARFKYPPWWAPLSDLWQAMGASDPKTNLPRGYYLMQKSPSGITTAASAYCRVAAANKCEAGELAGHLWHTLPGVVALSSRLHSPVDVIRALDASLPLVVRGALTAYTAGCDGADGRGGQHQHLSETVLQQIRQCRLFAVVSEALPNAAKAKNGRELATLLYMSLPPVVFTGLTPKVAAQLEAMRALHQLPGELAEEVRHVKSRWGLLTQCCQAAKERSRLGFDSQCSAHGARVEE
jgi:glutathione gamma-glutamylcysteinyltransferase